MTLSEYEEFDICQHKLLTVGYHILVLKAPWGVDALSSKLSTLTEQAQDAGRLTARRRAAMLLCYDFHFKNLIMMDDNIASLSCLIGEAQEPDWASILKNIVTYHEQAAGIISTVQTQSQISSHAPSNRIGWKILLFKMDCVRTLFARDQSYFLFPCNLTASSEDAFVQLFIHIASQRSATPKPGFSRLSLEQCFLVRNRNRASSHACVNSGVYAQPLNFQEHEESAAKRYLSEEQFESIRMAMLIFNKNISFNEDIRVKSNIYRTKHDISASIYKKRLNKESDKSMVFSLNADIETFQQALENMASSESLALRAPQADCLKQIARESKTTSEILITILPTGVGKTRVEAYLAYSMYHAHPGNHTIIIAPTRILSKQIDEDFYNESFVFDKKYGERLIPVYASENASATSLNFLLQNKKAQSNQLGHVFAFCQKSFHELLKIATTQEELLHKEALLLLKRLKMFIFDEEHMTYSPNIAKLLKKLTDTNQLPQLTHILGLTATSPADPLYQAPFPKMNKQRFDIPRKIIFNYSVQESEKAGFIRKTKYEVAHKDTISNFLNSYNFTDDTPLFQNVGIIACESIPQVLRLERELKEKLPALNVYGIHSSTKDYRQKITDFSEKKEHAVALVVDMLRTSYNHPQVRYTVMLKKSSDTNSRDREQLIGRARRKINDQDNYFALFVDLTLTQEQELTKNNALMETNVSLLEKRARSDSDLENDSITEPRRTAISFSSSSDSLAIDESPACYRGTLLP